MHLRKIDADRDDMDALLQLIHAAFAYMDDRIDPPSSARMLDAVALREKARSETGFVIEHNGTAIACLFCKPEATGLLYLGKLAVLPEMQNRGLGRKLLQAAEKLAQTLGLAGLRLETRVELVENHAAFLSWGFTKTAENRHQGYNRTTSIEMVKSMDLSR